MEADSHPNNLYEFVGAFGCSEESLCLLEGKDPASDVTAFEYQDLFQANSKLLREMGLDFSAVVVSNNQPLIYLIRQDALSRAVRASRLEKQAVIAALGRTLACRGYQSFLAFVEPGKLTLYSCALAKDDFYKAGSQFLASESPALIQDLAQGHVPRRKLRKVKESIHDLLLATLNRVTDLLQASVALEGLSHEKRNQFVLALVGRALFARFLVDREILSVDTCKSLFAGNCRPENWFEEASSAAILCHWLDQKFNGEFLPFPAALVQRQSASQSENISLIQGYRSSFEDLQKIDTKIFWPLGHIMSKADADGQLPLWGFIDFAHVPVGLLSEVYEDFMHRYDGKSAAEQSVYYTPRHIAEMLVNQAFAGLDTTVRHRALILDPASGAGVFLVLCLRRLIKERWTKIGRRPDSKEIREILYRQIRGFDINPNALLLSSLSLYLTAVELDPNPLPPEKLFFPEKLIGNVLVDVRESAERSGLGSLGDHVSKEYDGQFDLVIGNPPWSNKKDDIRLDKAAESIAERVIQARADSVGDKALQTSLLEHPYKNPDFVPDLPFVWRSMEWAKPKGLLVFALHARLLFKKSEVAKKSRVSLFRNLRVTGIINGAALREVRSVWPKVKAQYCFFFAINRISKPDDVFRYFSLQEEKQLNQQSRFRIDPHQAELIEFRALEEEPWLLKTLFRGNGLDVGVIRKLQMRLSLQEGQGKPHYLEKYWKDHLGLFCGKGYQTGGLKDSGKDLIDLKAKKFEAKNKKTFGQYVDITKLDYFDYEKLHNKRNINIYKTPVVICNESFGPKDSIRVRSSFDEGVLAYSESFVGFSSHKHSLARELACYIFLHLKSDLLEYFYLMTSSKYGVERYTILAEDIYEFPILDFDQLDDNQLKSLRLLAEQLYAKGNLSDVLINDWIFALYGISSLEREVIENTLETNLPYKDSRERAQHTPSIDERMKYCNVMQRILNGLISLVDSEVEVKPVVKGNEGALKEWLFVDIRRKSKDHPNLSFEKFLEKITLELANREGSSQIILSLAPGWLRLGLLAQYRYWTPSRARLCTHDIVTVWNDSLAIWGDK